MLTRAFKVIIASISSLGAICFAGSPDNLPTNWNFKDIVRNPELADRVLARREIDPSKVSDDDIHSLIDGLRHDESRHNCSVWLGELKPRSTAIAISRLRDETLLEKVNSYNFPLKDLIPDITGWSDPAVLTRLRQLARDERVHLRRLAGQVLAGAGLDEDTELLIRLMHDEDEKVRESVVFGLHLYYRDNKYSREMIGALYPHIRAMIGKEKFANGDPAIVLLKLDPERAKKDLSAAELWSYDAPEGTKLVNAYLKLDINPPVEALEQRVLWFAEHNDNFNDAYDFHRSLDLLARSAPKLAERFVDTAANHPEERVREVGYKTMCRVAGILPPRDKLWAIYQSNPDAEYDEHQAVIAAISAIDGEIGNGGLEQYLWNSTADNWPKHRAALLTIEATEHVAILDRVASLLGKDGPPLDRNQRFKPLAKVASKQEDVLDDCDSNWYSLGETLKRLEIEYALKHPDSFKR